MSALTPDQVLAVPAGELAAQPSEALFQLKNDAADLLSASNPHYRCPLERLLPDPSDLETIKREGWRDQGILVVSVSDTRLDWVEREQLRRIGERLYGRMGARHVER